MCIVLQDVLSLIDEIQEHLRWSYGLAITQCVGQNNPSTIHQLMVEF